MLYKMILFLITMFFNSKALEIDTNNLKNLENLITSIGDEVDSSDFDTSTTNEYHRAQAKTLTNLKDVLEGEGKYTKAELTTRLSRSLEDYKAELSKLYNKVSVKVKESFRRLVEKFRQHLSADSTITEHIDFSKISELQDRFKATLKTDPKLIETTLENLGADLEKNLGIKVGDDYFSRVAATGKISAISENEYNKLQDAGDAIVEVTPEALPVAE